MGQRTSTEVKFASLLAVVASIAGGFPSRAPAADQANGIKTELHGLVGASMYVQTSPTFLLNGQGPLLLTAQNNTGGVTTGFDTRQSRLSFSLSGPEVDLFGAATPKATIEEDFFGLNSPGGYGEVSMLQRLRLAFVELHWENTSVRFGQDWELLFNGGPASLGHMAYPSTYFAGLSGWREPGVGFYHRITHGESSFELAGQILKSDWENPVATGASTSNVNNVDAGQLSGWPGVEARVKWMDGDKTMIYVAGHYNRVGGSAAQSEPFTSAAPFNTYPNRDWDVVEAKVGTKLRVADFTLQADLYTGMNTAPLVGEQAVFYNLSDVHDSGGWLQVGYNFTPSVSLWGVAGSSRSPIEEVNAAGGGRFSNTVAGGMLQYKNGGFGIGPELYYVETKSTKNVGAGAPEGVMTGWQLMFSGIYTF